MLRTAKRPPMLPGRCNLEGQNRCKQGDLLSIFSPVFHAVTDEQDRITRVTLHKGCNVQDQAAGLPLTGRNGEIPQGQILFQSGISPADKPPFTVEKWGNEKEPLSTSTIPSSLNSACPSPRLLPTRVQ